MTAAHKLQLAEPQAAGRAARLQGCFPIFADRGQQPLPPAADDLIALRGELRHLGAPDGHNLVIRCALHRLDPAGRGCRRGDVRRLRRHLGA